MFLRNAEMAGGSLQRGLAHGADHFRRDVSGVLREQRVTKEEVDEARDMNEGSVFSVSSTTKTRQRVQNMH